MDIIHKKLNRKEKPIQNKKTGFSMASNNIVDKVNEVIHGGREETWNKDDIKRNKHEL